MNIKKITRKNDMGATAVGYSLSMLGMLAAFGWIFGPLNGIRRFCVNPSINSEKDGTSVKAGINIHAWRLRLAFGIGKHT